LGTRERILHAAREVIDTKGPVHATTREIARAAGLSEGALYKHFESKEELLLSLLKESPTGFVSMVMELPERAGSGSVRDNLQAIGVAAIDFYGESLPLGALFLADPRLLQRSQSLFENRKAGPHKAIIALAHYISAEQELGRIAPQVDPESVANLFFGACFQKAYLMKFLGQEKSDEEIERFIAGLLATLWPALK